MFNCFIDGFFKVSVCFPLSDMADVLHQTEFPEIPHPSIHHLISVDLFRRS
jgi:hypothetical protein